MYLKRLPVIAICNRESFYALTLWEAVYKTIVTTCWGLFDTTGPSRWSVYEIIRYSALSVLSSSLGGSSVTGFSGTSAVSDAVEEASASGSTGNSSSTENSSSSTSS